MNSNETQSPEVTLHPHGENKTRNSRLTLIAILVVSALPVVAAYFMFFTGIGVPSHTVNSGSLLKTPLPLKALLGESNPEYTEMLSHPKWRLLIPIGQSCSRACEQNLYTTRQVHIRLGEKSDRVERVAVNIGGTVGQRILDELEAEHPRMKQIEADAATWDAWLQDSGLALNNEQVPFYLLVDQEGFAMMAYTAEQHGNDLLKDLKRALKFSIDYE